MFDKSDDYGALFPTNLCLYYPFQIVTQSMITFSILEFVFHKIPASIADWVAMLCGKKTRCVRNKEIIFEEFIDNPESLAIENNNERNRAKM